MTGAQLIANERQEQIDKHGRTVIKDVSSNSKGELLMAAVKMTGKVIGIPWPEHWDKAICQKMDDKTEDEKLVIAGAMIAAEIDRRMKLDGAIFGKSKLEGDEFLAAVRPLMKYLAEQHHPHTTAIVTSTNGQVMEGLKGTGEILDYIKD